MSTFKCGLFYCVLSVVGLFTASPVAAQALSDLDSLRYIASHDDLVQVFGADAAKGRSHYEQYGIKEGRKITFEPLYYTASYPELIEIFGSDEIKSVTHYIQWGYKENRRTTFGALQALRYVASHPDLVPIIGADPIKGVRHYLDWGYKEKRRIDFDVMRYAAANPDLLGVFGSDQLRLVTHYLQWGYNEGRNASFSDLDALRYIASYADLIAAFGADVLAGIRHYVEEGFKTGRRIVFDALAYIASHVDLIQALGSDAIAGAKHYINWGYQEGRRITFDVMAYLANHADVRQAFGSDTAAATSHYISFGFREGRSLDWSASSPTNRSDAHRFLVQSTFGPTERDIQALMGLSESPKAYERWIDAQMQMPPSLQLPSLVALVPPSPPIDFNIPMRHRDRVEKWFEYALWGEDQLRQRVAWALSQIFVVSDAGVLDQYPFATADFYDMLAKNAFGNYRNLLESVTLHPAMGLYLSHLGNRRAQPGTNLRPDENYAREMMQLFSIGLVELELDGTVRRNADGQPISTYNPEIISGFARVFTGWHWQCPQGIQWVTFWGDRYTGNCEFRNLMAEVLPVQHAASFNQTLPMKLYPEEHEDGTKKLLNYPGARLPNGIVPAGQGGTKDLNDALDNVFYHPNVGPFIGRQLIQRLVTSNPSPAYVRDVAKVFNDDGSGVRGNLAAVVRAILLHPEARKPPQGATAGKIKEPILRLTQFWRAYEVKSESRKFDLDVFCCSVAEFGTTLFNLAPNLWLGQSPNQSPSVFNFYTPAFAPLGEISQAGLVAPELQLATEHLQTKITSLFHLLITSDSSRIRATERGSRPDNDIFYINDFEWDNAYDDEKLIAMVSKKLLGDPQAMSPSLRKAIQTRLDRLKRHWQPGDPNFEGKVTDIHLRQSRANDAIFLTVISPEYALQR